MDIKSLHIKILALLGILIISCQTGLIFGTNEPYRKHLSIYKNADKENNIIIPAFIKKTAIVAGSTTMGTIIGFFIGNCVPFMPVMKYDMDGTPDWTPAVIKLLGSTSLGAVMGVMAGIKITRLIYYDTSDYIQEDLVSAYLVWSDHKYRLWQLKYEAFYISNDRIVKYIVGTQHIATINANDLTINTNIGDGKFVKLSFSDFNKLISDENIIDLANKRLEKQKLEL